MKKTIAVLTAAFALSICASPVSAEETTTAFVTIVDAEGEIVVAAKNLHVTDTDGDGVHTIHDALYLAHEECYEGGAAAGYAASRTEYGLGITKLWGTEQGSGYGYCVNDQSAMSLEDPISHAARITAFVYTDTVNYSDTYSFFDISDISTSTGETYEFTLSANSYDASWNPIVVPVEGAVITIDGERTDYVTDAEGKVTVTFDKAGDLVYSAVSDSMTLVPPICLASIVGVPETTAPEATSPETTAPETTAAATTSAAATTAAGISVKSTTTPKSTGTPAATGDHAGIFAAAAAAIACLTAACAMKKRHED